MTRAISLLTKDKQKMPIPVIETKNSPVFTGIRARYLYFTGKHNKPAGVAALGFNYGGRGYRTSEFKDYDIRTNKVISDDGTKINGDRVFDLYEVPAE